MTRTRAIWIVLLYVACIAAGIVVGLMASGLIVIAAAGPKCCSPGDGIGIILYAVALVPLGGVLGIVLATTILRVRKRAENSV